MSTPNLGVLPSRACFVNGVKIQNYKSIKSCNVILRPFTVIVGPNGSGKSNFLDALRLISDSLQTTIGQSLRDRGGINDVRRRSQGHPTHFGISLSLQMPSGFSANYAFKIGALPKGAFIIQEEKCRIHPDLTSSGTDGSSYLVREGQLVESSSPVLPKRIEPDRLFLPMASNLPEFRPLYDGLSRMGFYSLNPEKIRELQETDSGDLLARDGRNLAAVIRRLKSQDEESLKRIVEYLRSVVPGISSVDPRQFGPKETLEFRQKVGGGANPWQFLASNMSDGTLRVLGVLVAAAQSRELGEKGASLIGIEEPESAVHPGSAVKLMDALLEAQKHTQILITTHSPDLLSHTALSYENILAVDSQAGETKIASMDGASAKMIKEKLYTVGELLQLGQVEPDEKQFQESAHQGLFNF